LLGNKNKRKTRELIYNRMDRSNRNDSKIKENNEKSIFSIEPIRF
jgi:hypothetical protein